MSPSEEKGFALGLRMLGISHQHETTMFPNGEMNVTRVVAKFEMVLNGRRHYLTAHAKSRPGAWRVAVRWLRQLQKGKLR
jgi:hypothetical protein